MKGLKLIIEEKIKFFLPKKQKINEIEDKLVELKKDIEEREIELSEVQNEESGFYKDIKAQKEELENNYNELNKKKENLSAALKNDINNEKNEIIEDLRRKQNIIDLNRNVNLKNADLDFLKKAKKVLEEEIKLNNTTKGQFLKLDDKSKARVRKAKERYLLNKKRLEKVNPIIEYMELLENKEPKQKYIEINELIKEVNDGFTIDKLDTYKFSVLEEDIKESKIDLNKEIVSSNEKVQEEIKPKNDNVKQEIIVKKVDRFKDHKDLYRGIYSFDDPTNESEKSSNNEVAEDELLKDYIYINENKKVVSLRKSSGEVIEYNTDLSIFDKIDLYKELGIKEICKNQTDNIFKATLLSSKLNPAIIRVYKNDKEAIKKYIASVNNKEEFEFDLKHDFTNINTIKGRFNKYIKSETLCGAEIVYGKRNNDEKEDLELKDSFENRCSDFKKTYKLVMQDRQNAQLENDLEKELRGEVNRFLESKKNEEALVNKDYLLGIQDLFDQELEKMSKNKSDNEDIER